MSEAGLDEIRESRLQELEERLNRLEERNRRPEPPKIKGTRRQFLGVMSFGAVAALLPGVTTAQTPSETAAQQYCVMQGPVDARPEPQEDCRWIYLEGDPDQPNSQVIRFTEGEAWHLFDVVPKNQYGIGFVDHPDYTDIADVLNDVGMVRLGTGTYDQGFDLSGDNNKTIFGSGLSSSVQGNVTFGSNNAMFFTTHEVSGDMTIDGNQSLYQANLLVRNITLNSDALGTAYNGNLHAFQTVQVDSNYNSIVGCTPAAGTIGWSITLNGDNNAVIGNTNVSITDNGAGNDVAHNT